MKKEQYIIIKENKKRSNQFFYFKSSIKIYNEKGRKMSK